MGAWGKGGGRADREADNEDAVLINFFRTAINGFGVSYGIRFTPRVQISAGIISTMKGVPLRYAIIRTRDYLKCIQSFQLHVLRLRVGVMLPLLWKPNNGPEKWSFPKMPANGRTP